MKQKHRRAVGINYQDQSDVAPVVSLKVEGIDADFAVKIAKRFGIPIVEHDIVAKLLGEVPLDAEIPKPLFEAVATIINELEN